MQRTPKTFNIIFLKLKTFKIKIFKKFDKKDCTYHPCYMTKWQPNKL